MIKKARAGEYYQLKGRDLEKPVFKAIVEISTHKSSYANYTMCIT